MKKISIVVPCYGTEEYVEKCINSLLNQTYSNIEVIAVNDCSKGNMQEILESLAEKDARVKVLKNEKNKGLFHTRIVGSKKVTGDYIAFVDSDDYVDIDYFRLLIEKAENDDCDVVLANYVREKKNKKTVAGLSYNTNNAVIDGKDFYNMFFDQTGRNIRNHMLCSKLINIEVWQKVIKIAEEMKERIVMTEDFLFSSIALYYAKNVGFCDNAIYYYVNNEKQSTNTNNANIEKINRNIKDIRTTFEFVKQFLIKEKIFDKYKDKFEIWRAFYLSMHINVFKDKKKQNKNLDSLEFDYMSDEGIRKFKELAKNDKSWDNYHGLETEYDESFNKIKEMIFDKSIEIISFDMFDTLVVRPFFIPRDMFRLLNKEFIQLFNPIKTIDFSKIRVESEKEVRDIKHQKGINEVTLDEIYDYISETYQLDIKILQKIKQKEIEMEVHFCKRRNSGYELYSLAKFLKKKVILTSDIYLPKEVILKILEKNGYEFDEYYISSELLKTKANGDLYEYIKEREKTTNILHIGDNYHSDIVKAEEKNLKAAQLFKAIDVMMGYTSKNVHYCGNLYKHFCLFNIDHIPYEENYGVRCSLGIVANYYFDNPFRPFNKFSDFNGDPDFIGYYALGMQTISMCKWLIEDAENNSLDSICFMARDGYLPYEATKIYSEMTGKGKNIKYNYTYVSRKSLMPLLFRDKSGLSLIDTYLNFDMLTPKDIIEQLKLILDFDSKKEKELSHEMNLNEIFKDLKDFRKKLSIIYDKCFSKEKYNKYFNMCKKYFSDQFSGKTATFDVGYSGKPETIISSVIEKPINTYFIHANSSAAFENTNNCDSKLMTFYEYKPTLTGTTRELFISNSGPSCKGYKYEDNKVVPIFSKSEKYNYFNIDMINKIQNGALKFVKDFCDSFGEYIDLIDLNKYYMSVPIEYYYHYTQMEDRLPTKHLLFEDNVNHYVELNDFIFDRYRAYASEYSLEGVEQYYHKDKNINYSLPRGRAQRIIYYTLHDRGALKEKWNSWANKKYDQNQLPNSRIKRIIYYAVFDRKSLRKKLFKSGD